MKAGAIFPNRAFAPMPPARLRAIPWLVVCAGSLRMLVTPWTRGVTLDEEQLAQVATMRACLVTHRAAGRLLQDTAAMLYADGRLEQVAMAGDCLLSRMRRFVVVRLEPPADV